MTLAKTLIDKAAGGRSMNWLADQLGADAANIRAMRSGKRPIPSPMAARLAHMAGLNPIREALTSVVCQEKDAERRAELAKILGVELGTDSAGIFIM